MLELPGDLTKAFSNGGRPTKKQVRRLMELEAQELGMTLKEATDAAMHGTLPSTPIGIDLRYWISQLKAQQH